MVRPQEFSKTCVSAMVCGELRVASPYFPHDPFSSSFLPLCAVSFAFAFVATSRAGLILILISQVCLRGRGGGRAQVGMSLHVVRTFRRLRNGPLFFAIHYTIYFMGHDEFICFRVAARVLAVPRLRMAKRRPREVGSRLRYPGASKTRE